MTYTMGRRALRVFSDRGAKAADRLETDFETVEAMFTVATRLISGAVLVIGMVVLAPLYIVASPFMLINWVAKRRAEKAETRDKAERYQRYLQKQAQK